MTKAIRELIQSHTRLWLILKINQNQEKSWRPKLLVEPPEKLCCHHVVEVILFYAFLTCEN